MEQKQLLHNGHDEGDQSASKYSINYKIKTLNLLKAFHFKFVSLLYIICEEEDIESRLKIVR